MRCLTTCTIYISALSVATITQQAKINSPSTDRARTFETDTSRTSTAIVKVDVSKRLKQKRNVRM